MKRSVSYLLFVPLFCFSQKQIKIDTTKFKPSLAPVTFTFSGFGKLDPDTIKKRTEIINRIFQSDNLILQANTAGCFHSFTVKYIFIKEGSKYKVTCKMHNEFDKNNEPEIKNYIITPDKLHSIKKICLHGLEINSSLCTTRKGFILSDGKNKTFFVDDRCDHEDDIFQKLGDVIDKKLFE